MAELENLLLQAAGRTGASSRKNQSSNANSKRRRESPGSDCRRLSGDESDSAPSFGSDLYRNEEDKEELSKLSELKREWILTSRRTRIDDYRLKKRARAEYSGRQNPSSPPPQYPSHGASSVKTDALNELRARRVKRQQEQRTYHMFKDLVGVKSDSDDGKEHKSSENIADIDDNLDDVSASKSRRIIYEDAKDITIRRSKLAKWHMEPFFEKIVVGCFVRLGIGRTRHGPKYRLCVVKNVDATDLNRQYELAGRTTRKWLNCTWGSEASAARWQMAVVSDSPPTEEEFNEWVTEMERHGSHIPSLQEVEDMKEQIQKASTFVYSAKIVKEMVDQKKLSCSRPINVAAEKIVLKTSIESAESAGKDAEAERLRAKLKKLEDLSKPVDAKGLKLQEMNRKNREENYKKALDSKLAVSNLRVGDEGYDPFSRKWTRPQLAICRNVETIDAGNDSKPVEAMEDGKDEGKLIDTRPPVDYAAEMMRLHDFDLPISLDALYRFQDVHHGLMARKMKIEASIGVKVPDSSHGRRDAMALSISDYKRRRELL